MAVNSPLRTQQLMHLDCCKAALTAVLVLEQRYCAAAISEWAHACGGGAVLSSTSRLPHRKSSS
jgi:hypothetical protein